MRRSKESKSTMSEKIFSLLFYVCKGHRSKELIIPRQIPTVVVTKSLQNSWSFTLSDDVL